MSTTHPSPADLLTRIAQIQLMERGKLSTYRFKERGNRSPAYFKLQRWEEGRNCTRYVRAEQVALLEQALAGYSEFEELVEQYARQVIERTREQLATVGRKKKPGPRPGSSWRRSKKSGS